MSKISQWKTDPYLNKNYPNFELKSKIAAFDIDTTIITTKSKKKFAINKDDWMLLYKETKEVLEKLNKEGYSIIFISNQAGLKTGEDISGWTTKIDNVQQLLNIPISVYASTGKDMYRKPLPTFWNIISDSYKGSKVKLDKKNSYYCGDAAGRAGDAAGRAGDHSDTDYKFALNCGLTFYVPEETFLNQKCSTKKTEYAELPKCKTNGATKITFSPKEMIIMVGYPASGKSYFTTEYVEKAGYTRINQDTLKTKKKCLDKALECLNKGESIVIDNLNHTVSNRGEYIKLAQRFGYNISAYVMTTSFEVSQHNNLYRCWKTNGVSEPVPCIVYNMFRKNYEEPTTIEGINNIVKLDFNRPSDKDYEMFFS